MYTQSGSCGWRGETTNAVAHLFGDRYCKEGRDCSQARDSRRATQPALDSTVRTAGFEAFRQSDVWSLEFRHEGKGIDGLGQKVKTD
jgi:hypothetical protein